MKKEILDKLIAQATEDVVVGYIKYTIPPIPIHKKIFNREKFAELVISEAIYVGGGLVTDIAPEYNGKITVHEAGKWQKEMQEHFKV